VHPVGARAVWWRPVNVCCANLTIVLQGALPRNSTDNDTGDRHHVISRCRPILLVGGCPHVPASLQGAKRRSKPDRDKPHMGLLHSVICRLLAMTAVLRQGTALYSEQRTGLRSRQGDRPLPGQTVSKLFPASHWGAGIVTETGMPSGNPRSAGALPGQAFHQFLAARYIDYPF
jgi:hypothetical protein